MREYLFRGKRKDNGKWIEGDLTQDRDLGTAYISGWDYYTDSDGLQREPFGYEVIPETVGEFTDLTDKNGVKIFEGDIAKLPNPKPFKDFICFVQYNDGCFDLINKLRRWRDYLKCYVCNHAVAVIGNIYDNPELLKEASE